MYFFIDAKGIAFIFVLVFYKHAAFPTPRQQQNFCSFQYLSVWRVKKWNLLLYLFLLLMCVCIFSCIFDYADFHCYKHFFHTHCYFSIIYIFLINFWVFYRVQTLAFSLNLQVFLQIYCWFITSFMVSLPYEKFLIIYI